MTDAELTRRFDQVDARLGVILDVLRYLLKGEAVMSAELDALTVQVRQSTDVEQSAIVLLNKLSDMIKANADNPAALRQLATDLDTGRQALAAAVVINTPAAGAAPQPAGNPSEHPAPPPPAASQAQVQKGQPQGAGPRAAGQPSTKAPDAK